MGAAFRPCGGCGNVPYAAVLAKWYNTSSGPKSTFTSAYGDAITRVKSIDIATVPSGQVRYFDYSAADGSYVDHGNVANTPSVWPGISGFGGGISDYGAITAGSPSGWLGYVGQPYNFYGDNPFGGQQAHWSGPDTGDGWFLVMRLAVSVGNQPCNAKWCLVNWDNNWYPSPGFYSIDCLCDATGPGGCPACTDAGSFPIDTACVDIPDPSGFYQYDASLPCSARYFIPGYNCSDLT